MSTSVGALLRSQRDKRRLALTEIQKQIKIHPTYLRALEEDNYSVFDGKVHAKGFLKVYATYLGLNLDEVLALWRREHEPELEVSTPTSSYKLKSLEPGKLVLTPKLVLNTVLALSVLLFFSYLYYQYKSYTSNPSLNITHPSDNQIVNSDTLDVTGNTETDADLYINNQKVVLNPNGSFAVTLKIKEGINTLNIISVNKLNKKTEDIRTVIYRPLKENPLPDLTKEASPSSPSVIPTP